MQLVLRHRSTRGDGRNGRRKAIIVSSPPTVHLVTKVTECYIHCHDSEERSSHLRLALALFWPLELRARDPLPNVAFKKRSHFTWRVNEWKENLDPNSRSTEANTKRTEVGSKRNAAPTPAFDGYFIIDTEKSKIYRKSMKERRLAFQKYEAVFSFVRRLHQNVSFLKAIFCENT